MLRHPKVLRCPARVASLLLTAVVAISAGMATGVGPAAAGFYDVAKGELAGQPGTLIRQERMSGAPHRWRGFAICPCADVLMRQNPKRLLHQ